MLFYQGKYNYAKVMIDTIDEATVSQIYKMLDHPAFKDLKIVIMPDTHSGAGSVIGFTATLGESIIPNIVGVNISAPVKLAQLLEPSTPRQSASRVHRNMLQMVQRLTEY
jgi:RNA-splicing ligase RtcB